MAFLSRLGRAFFFCVLGLALVSCSPRAPKPMTTLDIQRACSEREKWRVETMVGAYDKVGSKNPKWDEAAHNALETFAKIEQKPGEQQGKDFEQIGLYASQAVHAGCDDPLINYLNVILLYNHDGQPTNDVVKTYTKVASDMDGSAYPEIRKFYSSMRAANRLWHFSRYLGNYTIPMRAQANAHLVAALNETNLPPMEAQVACVALLGDVYNNKQQLADFYQRMEPPLFRNFAGTPAPYAVKGYFNIGYAWQARGNDSADKVTKEGWKLFAERAAIAHEAYETAWRLNPADPWVPTQMVNVMLAQGGDRADMELWFQRAMQADPNNSEACASKLYYLYPRWYGSYEDMLAFGRECLTNQAWGGDVTLELVNAHWAISVDSGEGNKYWERPEVWPEIKASFQEYFRRNPENISYHHNYMWYANAGGDWKTVNEQVPLLGPINYDYFGGQPAYEEMVRNAREKAGK